MPESKSRRQAGASPDKREEGQRLRISIQAFVEHDLFTMSMYSSASICWLRFCFLNAAPMSPSSYLSQQAIVRFIPLAGPDRYRAEQVARVFELHLHFLCR
ncbi:hypothetical protein PCANC_01235 [Puccinia coronata f. sp. avenae]|uniref:Uncharacterized protein n=1 Tax=Puccinia coronata f. sp. avenae TaxID=200324 RepID=A0A2N5W3J6_9BASI|nr:hypothetical protein PCASD_17219 [Puccinia coronata f. sp. avenae]PLW56828.1 hypothetical protein PCANC_01235 [Puccinia coronata f. sp. avenae]